MLKELFCLDKLPAIELYTDSKSMAEHLESTRVIGDPRLRVDIARLREMKDIGEIEVKWVKSELQLADCMTKKGASTELLRRVLVSVVLTGDHHEAQTECSQEDVNMFYQKITCIYGMIGNLEYYATVESRLL